MTVDDWCALKRERNISNVNISFWGDGTLKYGGSYKPPCLVCTAGEDSIAFVQIFGASPSGPYHYREREIWFGGGDPYYPTRERLPYAVLMYVRHFGSLPDRVVFSSLLWDVMGLRPKFSSEDAPKYSEAWNLTYSTFERNYNETMHQLIDVVENITNLYNNRALSLPLADYNRTATVNIGVRTSVWTIYVADYIHEFNSYVRSFAETHRLTIYDFDEDVWSAVLPGRVRRDWDMQCIQNEKVVRDNFIHPKPIFVAAAAEKMLGRRYSGHYTYREREDFRSYPLSNSSLPYQKQLGLDQGQQHHHHYSHHLHRKIWIGPNVSEGSPGEGLDVYLVKELKPSWLSDEDVDNRVFYTRITDENDRDYISGMQQNVDSSHLRRVRHPHAGSIFQQMFCLGTGDILHLPSGMLDKIPVVAPVSDFLLSADKPLVIRSALSRTTFLLQGRERRSFKSQASIPAICRYTQSNVIVVSQDLTDMLPAGPEIPDIYDKHLLLIQHSSSNSVWVVDGKWKRYVSLPIFYKYGWEFSNVTRVSVQFDIDIIPIGPPME